MASQSVSYVIHSDSRQGVGQVILVYLNFAQISDNMLGRLESKEQLLSQ